MWGVSNRAAPASVSVRLHGTQRGYTRAVILHRAAWGVQDLLWGPRQAFIPTTPWVVRQPPRPHVGAHLTSRRAEETRAQVSATLLLCKPLYLQRNELPDPLRLRFACSFCCRARTVRQKSIMLKEPVSKATH